jgi:repressor LexA
LASPTTNKPFWSLAGNFRADTGVMPSLRAIQGHFKFGSSNAEPKRLQTLEKEGAMQRSGGAAWSMTMTGMVPASFLHIPMVGIIPAGYPSDQEQQSDRCVSIDEDTLQLPKNARTFALEVRGDSMIDAHIVAGDVVIMELRDPTHRDIVAALIDGETTLKRFLLHKGKPFLRAWGRLRADRTSKLLTWAESRSGCGSPFHRSCWIPS